jgi:hypothetical protein
VAQIVGDQPEPAQPAPRRRGARGSTSGSSAHRDLYVVRWHGVVADGVAR